MNLSSRWRRLALLGLPAVATVGVLMALSLARPAREGVLAVTSAQNLPLKIDQTVTLQGRNAVRQIALRNARVQIRATRVLAAGKALPGSGSLSVELSHDAVLTYALTTPGPAVAQSLKLDPTGKSAINLRVEKIPESGFYLDIGGARGAVRGAVLVPPGASARVRVQGARVVDAAGRAIAIPDDGDSLVLDVASSDDASALTFVQTQDSEGVLSVRFDSGGSPVDLFSGRNVGHLSLPARAEINFRQLASLYLDGVKVSELFASRVRTEGSGLRILDDISVRDRGLDVAFAGRFERLDAGATGTTSLLPTLLSSIGPLALILLGGMAYVIDKIITVYRFVARPAED